MRPKQDVKRLRTEKNILREYAEEDKAFPAPDLRISGRSADYQNPRSENEIGIYRSPESRRLATADVDILRLFEQAGSPPPSFPEAGPRKELCFDPHRVKAAVVTTGGLAPGLNSVVHSIVDRHFNTYELNETLGGAVYGIYDGFRGLRDCASNSTTLNPKVTLDWLRQGGSNLGSIRFRDPQGEKHLVDEIAKSITQMAIDILYVIGGDGSQLIAHKVAQAVPSISVLGVPKTMDNDVLWVRESFGFDTTVEQATHAINALHFEAQSTRRVGLLQFFGAESGFVAANAALASGQVDLVLIPEAFNNLSDEQLQHYWKMLLGHLDDRVKRQAHMPHAIVVVAEGVETALVQQKSRKLGRKGDFLELLKQDIAGKVRDRRGRCLEIFVNEPRHYIRSGAANAHDQIFCERLGALAVDNGLAGYTNCMVSHWLTEYVLVPLELVVQGQKSIQTSGMFWRQVETSTGQPPSPCGPCKPKEGDDA